MNSLHTSFRHSEIVLYGFTANVFKNNFYIFDHANTILRNTLPWNNLPYTNTSYYSSFYLINLIPYFYFASNNEIMHPNNNALVKSLVYISH